MALQVSVFNCKTKKRTERRLFNDNNPLPVMSYVLELKKRKASTKAFHIILTEYV